MLVRLETGQSTYERLPWPTALSKFRPGSPPNRIGSTTVAGVNFTKSLNGRAARWPGCWTRTVGRCWVAVAGIGADTPAAIRPRHTAVRTRLPMVTHLLEGPADGPRGPSPGGIIDAPAPDDKPPEGVSRR